MMEFEYVRSALKNGIKMEAELGVNPYKFGLVWQRRWVSCRLAGPVRREE
jgi:hypothetical protein